MTRSELHERVRWRVQCGLASRALATTATRDATALTSARERPAPAAMRTVVIQGGRKDKLRPGDIVGALTGELGVPNDAIGLITIRDRVAFVAIARDEAERALREIERGQIKGRSFGAFFLC